MFSRRLTRLMVCLVAVSMFNVWSIALADDAAQQSVSGTWTWTMQRPGGGGGNGGGGGDRPPRQVTLTLQQDGDKLAGTITGFRGQDIEIQDGTIKDGQITFKVVRKRDDREFTSTYTGTLENDTIKGKIESNWGPDGQTRSRDWEAKRGGAPTTQPAA